MTPEAACKDVNQFCNSLVDGQVTLKKSHYYHHQLQGQLVVTQGQLVVTQLPWCDYLIWPPHGASV